MISATYFGEITELDSRAVWYSDDEDGDQDEEDEELGTARRDVQPVEALSHETFRHKIQATFDGFRLNINSSYDECIVSLLSGAQFKNSRFNLPNNMKIIGCLGTIGKVYHIQKHTSYPGSPNNLRHLLWLQLDASNKLLISHEVGYFVEGLLDALANKFNLVSGAYLYILTQQFSNSEDLEYLNNYDNPQLKLPVIGRAMTPPTLIKNQFESALFEQATLLLRPALIVCLPDPRNFWFDSSKNWPSIPKEIIEQKLNDDSLEKTLIFT